MIQKELLGHARARMLTDYLCQTRPDLRDTLIRTPLTSTDVRMVETLFEYSQLAVSDVSDGQSDREEHQGSAGSLGELKQPGKWATDMMAYCVYSTYDNGGHGPYIVTETLMYKPQAYGAKAEIVCKSDFLFCQELDAMMFVALCKAGDNIGRVDSCLRDELRKVGHARAKAVEEKRKKQETDRNRYKGIMSWWR